MAHKSKRRHPRMKCKLPCELSVSGKRSQGVVRDVSVDGLSVHTSLSLAEGEHVRVCVHHPRCGSFELEAIVWHGRQVRRKGTNDRANLLGMRIARGPDDWQNLLSSTKAAPTMTVATSPANAPRPRVAERPAPARPPAAPRPEPPEPEPPKEPPPSVSPADTRYRVRVKLEGSPRTRVLVVEAASDDAAVARAVAEVGAGWTVIEVTLA